MELYKNFDQEIFLIKEDLKQALKRIGGKADIRELGKEFKRNIDFKKFGIDNFTQLLRNFQDIFDIDRYTISLKPENQLKQRELKDERFELQKFSTTINLDQCNETLLFEDSSSSTSTVYKEVKSSMKIPAEQREYTGCQQLSSSDTSDGSEKEFQKTMDKIYSISENDRKGFNETFKDLDENASETKSFSSLEALSSIEGDVFNMDDEEIKEMLASDVSGNTFPSLNQFISSLAIDDEVFFSHLPPVNRDEKATVPMQNIEKDFKEKVLYLSEIFDPVHFWFQFVSGDLRYEGFEPFHDKFNKEYKDLKEKELVIADENYKVGLLVACYVPKFKHWYRARITQNYNGEKAVVRLFFLDYGTNGICSKSNIRYLFEHFMKYPQYAIRGRIAGIVPIDNVRSFKINQIEDFIKKISHHSFYGTAVKYEPEEDVYQLDLIRRKDDANMKEYLIENKIAEPMNPRENDGEYSIGPPCYLIPSFKALEYDYPTYGNLENMNRSDVNFNLVIDSNFLHCCRREDIEGNEELKVIVQDSRFSSIKKYFYGFD